MDTNDLVKKLKVDPIYPHHYLISVGIKNMISSDPGKIYLKHGPIYFNNDDVEKLRNSILLSKDKLFVTDIKTSLEIHNVSNLVSTIAGMKLAAKINNCSLHHFSSEFKITDDYEWFKILVNSCNKITSQRRLLDDSRIG